MRDVIEIIVLHIRGPCIPQRNGMGPTHTAQNSFARVIPCHDYPITPLLKIVVIDELRAETGDAVIGTELHALGGVPKGRRDNEGIMIHAAALAVRPHKRA